MNTCPNCHAPVADGCRFCGACGAPIPQEPVAPAKVPAPGDAKPAPTTCPNCGKTLPSGARFCQSCGAPIAAQAEPAAVQAEPAAAQTEPITAQAEPAAAQTEPAAAQAEPAAAQAEPAAAQTEPAAAQTEPAAAQTEPITAQAEPAAAQTEPAAAQAEPAAAQAEPIAAWTEAPTARTRDAAESAKNTIAAKVKAAGSRSSAEGTPKRKKPTAKIIGISAVAVVLVVAIILGITLIPGKHASNTAIYLKDGDLCVLPNVKKNTDLLTMQMVSDPDALQGDITGLWDYQDSTNACSGCGATLSKDGSKLFYISTDLETEIRLCYIDLKAKNATPVRISGGVVLAFSVNESATLVTFLRDDNNLYQYDMQSGKAEKIASDLEEVFVASRDGSKIVYTTENGLYLYSSLGQTEKLSNDYCSQVYTPDDALSTIYYVDEDDTLFCNKTGKAEDSFKIASGIDTLYGLTENGVYYTTDSKTVTMYDYVNQDLLSVDPDSLERPEYPFSFEYDTDAEYQAAMKQYKADMEVYEHANDLRELQKDLSYIPYALVTLNYFNGSSASVVAEDVFSDSISSADTYAHAAAVLEYAYPDPEKAAAITVDDMEAIIDSNYSYASTASDHIYNKIRSSSVAVNGTACALDLDIYRICLTEDGQTACIITKNADNSDIDLYQAGISGNSLQTPTQIASDIDDLQIIGNNVVFWQDSAVFVNNARIDDDVLADHVAFRDDGSFVYLVGEEDDNSYQLKSYKDGKTTTIADDVFNFGFTTGGELLYLRDYNTNRSEGTLYLYNGKDSTKLDDDVFLILPAEDLAYDRGGADGNGRLYIVDF